MDHPRPGPVVLSLLGVLLALGAAVLAQAPPVTAPPEGPSPSELYRDVRCLELVGRLALTAAQIGKILPVVQEIADQTTADQQADAEAWTKVAAASGRVVAALLAGVTPPPADTALVDQAAAERNRREDQRAALVADSVARIQRMLTAEQAWRIETAALQAERLARQARLEGAETPVEYIVRKLDQQAELMPDEYLRTREGRALEMAAAILGENAPGTRKLAVALLEIMDEVADWTPAQYAEQRPTLADQVAKSLDLPAEIADDLVKYEDFAGWITSERTPGALKELLNARRPAAPEEEATP
jgi:hypothetical protein